MKNKCLLTLCMIVLTLSICAGSAFAAENGEYGTAGSITGEERNPEAGDQSNWLTIRAGEYGVRIVDKDGNERIAVDNFGGIYLNGDVYLNQQMLGQQPEKQPYNIANGFFYLLLVISIAMNIYCVVKIRKHS